MFTFISKGAFQVYHVPP